GRLKAVFQEQAAARGWPWAVEIVPSPDAVLLQTREIICTADSVILDGDVRWFNLARKIVTECVTGAYVVDLAAATHG
ncbi:MAG: DUF5616 domain-containing protein, partial [Tepidisphaeraceae bacterium]